MFDCERLLLSYEGRANKSMDVRAKQRLSYLAYPLSFNLRVGGFAPRHLSRCAALL